MNLFLHSYTLNNEKTEREIKETIPFTVATICSDFGAQQNKVSHCFHCFPMFAMK